MVRDRMFLFRSLTNDDMPITGISGAWESPLQSAYETAVAGGFTGTPEEWILSLQGGGSGISVGPTPPADPQNGDLWIDTSGV